MAALRSLGRRQLTRLGAGDPLEQARALQFYARWKMRGGDLHEIENKYYGGFALIQWFSWLNRDLVAAANAASPEALIAAAELRWATPAARDYQLSKLVERGAAVRAEHGHDLARIEPGPSRDLRIAADRDDEIEPEPVADLAVPVV